MKKNIKKRKKKDFFLFGKHSFQSFFERKPELIEYVFISDRLSGHEKNSLSQILKSKKIPFSFVPLKKIESYVGKDISHQGIIARIKEFPYFSKEDFSHLFKKEGDLSLLILDRIQDPHNFGAIIRSASAFEINAIVIQKNEQSPVNAVVLKSSAGTALSIPIFRVSNLAQFISFLKKNSWWIFSLDISEEESHFLWKHDLVHGKNAFIIGSEGNGVSRLLKEMSDYILTIPISRNVESLNVSVATAILLYERKRQQSIDYVVSQS